MRGDLVLPGQTVAVCCALSGCDVEVKDCSCGRCGLLQDTMLIVPDPFKQSFIGVLCMLGQSRQML